MGNSSESITNTPPVIRFRETHKPEDFVDTVIKDQQLYLGLKKFLSQLSNFDLDGDWEAKMEVVSSNSELCWVEFRNSSPLSKVLLVPEFNKDGDYRLQMIYRADVGNPTVLKSVYPNGVFFTQETTDPINIINDRELEWRVDDHTNDKLYHRYKDCFQ